MLTYFLIIFVIAVALAPLGHFLPSKRQRKVARMREYAAVHGMFVEFRALPDVGGTPLSELLFPVGMLFTMVGDFQTSALGR